MNGQKPTSLKFIYSKTPSYRTYNVDGVFGGLNKKNRIFLEVFSEKQPIPESVTHEISNEGIIGKEITKTYSKATILREIEAGIYMDIATAKVIADWLYSKIKDSELINKAEDK